MKQTYKILPVMTSDVSGVCSALYELGGMVVMHDPSGCNSTYNTHDETRWYDMDSLIFISGLTERDAITGNDKKFYEDILETARALRPKFVAITNSPVPYLMSTDFPAISKKLEAELKFPVFYVPANGMHDYTAGAGAAFEKAASRLVKDTDERAPGSVNILGVTPLDFAAKGSAASMKRSFEDAGFRVLSLWAMDESLENIQDAGRAAVNVVVSACGLAAAKRLKARFGTPYIAGVPVDGFADDLFDAVNAAERTGEDIVSYFKEFPGEGFFKGESRPEDIGRDEDEKGRLFDIAFVGDPVIMGSLCAAAKKRSGCSAGVICPQETRRGLLSKTDLPVQGEEEIKEALSKAKAAVGDPFYKLICAPGTRFYDLPFLSLSGRAYLKEAKDILSLKTDDILNAVL